MRKSTLLFLGAILLLVALIGAGIWIVSNRQVSKLPKTIPEETKSYTLDEVSQHNSKNDCWTIISGDVYDLTGFINRHPGGDEILRACGIDATTLFNSRRTQDGQAIGSGAPHSQAAKDQLAELKIGTANKK